MSEILKELEDSLLALEKKFAGANWKEQINEIAAEFRRLGTEFAQQEKIKGFVLELNGVDASRPVSGWPSVTFEAEKLVVKMSVLHLDKGAHITLEIEKQDDQVKVQGTSTKVQDTKTKTALDTLFPREPVVDNE